MRVVAVLGYSRNGDRLLHPICAHRVAHAERIATGARAVVLSGWARRHAPAGEAELMRAACGGASAEMSRSEIAAHQTAG